MNYELAYGCIGISEYLAELARRSGAPAGDACTALTSAFDLITEQEEKICGILIDYLNSVKGVKIIGETTSDAAIRVPTVSFVTDKGRHSDIVSAIDRFNIGIRYGDFYARRLADHLELDQEQGVIRVSMAHYNTPEEILTLIGKLDQLLS